VFLDRRPSVPSTLMWRVRPMLEQGRPAGFSDWPVRAREAESLGFAPTTYERLHASLDRVPAARYPSHPDNHLIRQGTLVPVRPFDVAVWAPWPSLVDLGTTDDEATRRLLDASTKRSRDEDGER
jgi:hypothetical protein